MHILLKNLSDVPIYEQVEQQIREQILCGQLPEGTQLPSIRQLARDLKISVVTTTRIYSDLTEEGFLQSVAGKGCFVAPRDNDLLRERMISEMETGMEQAVRSGKKAGLNDKELHDILQSTIDGLKEEGEL